MVKMFSIKGKIMNDNIGRRFLEEVDSYIKDNLRTLTCSQIRDFYYRFFDDLKDFKGNSNGFTGLSEYLIFRSLYHLLGGSFKRKKASGSNWIYEFESTINNRIRIGQSIPVYIYGKKLYPDITVYNGDILKSVAQIKLYLTHGSKEVYDEMEKLKSLRAQFCDMRSLLIIYDLSKGSKIINELKLLYDKESWFYFTILKGNEYPLIEVLTNALDLDKFIILP
jgi:hypothetical protein